MGGGSRYEEHATPMLYRVFPLPCARSDCLSEVTHSQPSLIEHIITSYWLHRTQDTPFRVCAFDFMMGCIALFLYRRYEHNMPTRHRC